LLLVETSATSAYALARRLYETSGYRCEAVIHNFYAPGDDLVIYVKDVTADQAGQEVAEIYRVALADKFVEAPVSASKEVIRRHPLRHQCGSLSS
jgi:hypothetical protein